MPQSAPEGSGHIMCVSHFIPLHRVWLSPLFPPKDGGRGAPSDAAATKDTGFQRDLLVRPLSLPLPPSPSLSLPLPPSPSLSVPLSQAECVLHYLPPDHLRRTLLPTVGGAWMSGRQESEIMTFPQLGMCMYKIFPALCTLQNTYSVL